MKNRLAPRGYLGPTPDGVVLRPVVALDIDGTMATYHDHFLKFAHQWLCKDFELMWPYDGSVTLAKYLGISKTTYRRIKLAYRQGGLKRSMGRYAGAVELARGVRAAGAEVWVCTTRPFLRLDNIDPDTRFWLRHNHIPYDGFLFGDHKYRDLRQLVGSGRVVGVADDLPEQVVNARKEGLNAYLVERDHNRHGRNGVPTLPSLFAALEQFTENIRQWKEEHSV